MGDFFAAIALLVEVFEKYAGSDGDSKTLSKKELSKLFQEQLGQAPAESMNDFFKALDMDGDGVVDFSEYVTFAASLALLIKGQ